VYILPSDFPSAALRILALPLVLSTGQWAQANESVESVASLSYGVSLYHYYQQDYLSALSELQVAQERGEIPGNGNNPLIMRGAMSLAFGMDRSATQIFNQVLDDNSSVQVRNGAWFYLGRMHYRRGSWETASATLDKIGGALDPTLQHEVDAMRVNVAIRTHNLAQAELSLDRKDKHSGWQPYLYYNLGTAHIRTAKLARGIDYLDQLAGMQVTSAEHMAIQDKGLTAAGYGLMQEQNYAAAVERFTRVRLDSPIAEQALLGYGWSALQLGDYQQALGPWQMLAARSALRPAVQEALLAVPHTYEKLGALGSALREFSTAEETFATEIARLDRLKNELQPRSLLAMLDTSVAKGDNEQPIDAELASLIELLSGDRFVQFSADFRDLDVLNQRLDHWRETIDIYRAMLRERSVGRAHKVSAVERADYAGKLAQITRQRDELAKALANSSDEQAIGAIADPQTRALWSRVQRAGGTLQRLQQAGEDVTEQQQQLSRYRGVLLWHASEQAIGWRWQANRQLQQLDKALVEAGETTLRTNRAIADAPDIAPFEQRLAALEQRLQVQAAAVASRQEAVEAAFYRTLAEHLDEQQDRLRYYQGQARLAKARLYDQAARETSL
jgi:hypothetical protein